MSTISIGILGPLEIQIDGVQLRLSGERSRRIVAALVDSGADGAGIHRLADVIWDDHDRPAEPNAHVRTAISRLRRVFNDAGHNGAAIIESRSGGGYRLGAPVIVDAWTFESELNQQPRIQELDPQRLARLEAALERWRGAPYIDVAATTELTPSVTRLTNLRLGTEEEHLGLLLDAGESQRVAARAGVLARDNPWREELQRLHALALYRTGRQTDALRALSEYSHLARAELGIDPGPELAALHTAILDHDPAISTLTDVGRSLRGYLTHETLRRSEGAVSVTRRWADPDCARSAARH